METQLLFVKSTSVTAMIAFWPFFSGSKYSAIPRILYECGPFRTVSPKNPSYLNV